MSDWTLPLQAVLVVGKSGSGKSTFVFRYLVNVENVACRFIFDDLGQCAARLHVPHASTANELESALATRWVVFNPHRMFPGDVQRAFRYFCKWTFDVSQRGRGRKIVFFDEVWRFQERDKIPKELAVLSQMGRAENVQLITATQHPHKINPSLSGNLSELVCFALDESIELMKIRKLGADDVAVNRLPKGSFIAYNKDGGGVLHGKIF